MKSRMRSALWILLLVSVLSLVQGSAVAAPKTLIKMATLAPEGTAWDKALKTMGAEWRRVTGGEVTLRIYPGGTAGDDADVVRKMRIGQLDAAGVTISGLTEMDASFEAFGIPMLFDSWEELEGVLIELEPYFRDQLESQGFVFLNWAHGGWAHIFSANPVRSVDDLRKVKLFVTAGDDKRVQWWKNNGFQPRPLAVTDILTGLQTGMIDAMVTTPLVTMSMQWYRKIPYMHNLPLGPLLGANVMTKRSWNRLPEESRTALLGAAKDLETQIFSRISEDDATSIRLMEERGLTVVESADEAEWREQIRRFATDMRGGIVPAETFDLMIETRDKVRRSLAEAGS
jgi:TRAP-type C4-dicarboxylate transport system substrate-binding protein